MKKPSHAFNKNSYHLDNLKEKPKDVQKRKNTEEEVNKKRQKKDKFPHFNT